MVPSSLKSPVTILTAHQIHACSAKCLMKELGNREAWRKAFKKRSGKKKQNAAFDLIVSWSLWTLQVESAQHKLEPSQSGRPVYPQDRKTAKKKKKKRIDGTRVT